MPRIPPVRVATLMLIAVLWQTPSAGQARNDAAWKTRRDQLLVSYAEYKQYPKPHDPARIYAALDPDRQAVLDAITRALFVKIEDRNGKVGRPVIDYVKAVRGIWGVRYGITEGKFMFRLSLLFDPSIESALRSSRNIPKASFLGIPLSAHVLLPKVEKSDDDQEFKDLTSLLVENGAITFRERTDPSLQISLLDDRPEIGDADIDFDAKDLICACHCQPSNSDVGSKDVRNKADRHLDGFNNEMRSLFSSPLATSWSLPAYHCKNTYERH